MPVRRAESSLVTKPNQRAEGVTGKARDECDVQQLSMDAECRAEEIAGRVAQAHAALERAKAELTHARSTHAVERTALEQKLEIVTSDAAAQVEGLRRRYVEVNSATKDERIRWEAARSRMQRHIRTLLPNAANAAEGREGGGELLVQLQARLETAVAQQKATQVPRFAASCRSGFANWLLH